MFPALSRFSTRAGLPARPSPPAGPSHPAGRATALATALALASTLTLARNATAEPRLPEIRTHAANRVPACVTPERLMAFLVRRNTTLALRYRDIARWYRHHGETLRVRWDYAFFQMALETNFLTYRRGDGSPGDVKPQQNNFAGIGATGGGVPGDRFRDVSTGVLAQLQHLVAYSGELQADPVAPRTKLKQADIVETMRRLKRPVRYSDLARRWAADRRYATSIAGIADSFVREHCSGRAADREVVRRRSDLGTPSANGASDAAPPPPRSASRARAHLVARTIWRRGTTVIAAGAQPQPGQAFDPNHTPAAVKAPAPVLVRTTTTTARAPDHPSPSNLLSGLQNLASTMQAHVADWPVTPPAPRPLAAPSRIAQRN